MMDLTTMPALKGEGGPGAAMSAGGDGTRPAEFLTRVAHGLEELTGKALTPEAVEAWLQGDPPPQFPSGQELAGLLDGILPGTSGELEDALAGKGEDIDVAALLGAWAASSSTRVEGRPAVDAAAQFTGTLRTGTDPAVAEELLAGLKAGERGDRPATGALLAAAGEGGEGGDTEAFRQALGAATGLSSPGSGHANGARTLATPAPIGQPVGQPGFGDAVGERVAWMVRNDVQQARIQLNPPGLGPLEISVSVGEDKAQVGLTAHHAVTRDALAADAGRLRAMLAENGFEQVDVDVSHRESGGREGFGDGDAGGASARGGVDGEAGDEGNSATEATVAVGRGLVDHYA